MTERSVSVSLRMRVRDYVVGAGQASTATAGLTREQEKLARQSRQTAAALTVTATAAASTGLQMRGLAYSGAAIAALGAAGGALKVLPPILAATGSSAAALPTILGGAATSMGVLKVASLGVGDALDAVTKRSSKDPFGNLSGNARRLVAQVSQLMPELDKFQQGLQDRALRGTDADLLRLARVTLPAVAGNVNALADDWANAFAEITLAASDPTVLHSFNTMAAGADRFFDQIIDRIRPASRAWAILFEAADPVAQMIGNRLVGSIDKFVNSVERAKRTGRLDEFFRAGAQQAGDLLSITGDIVHIMGMVIRQANTQATSLHQVAGAMNAYIASGRAAGDIAGIMDTLMATWEGMKDVLGPLAGMVKDALADPGTRQALETMLQVLTAVSRAVRAVFDVFQLLPDGVQGTVLAVVALVAVGYKAAAAIALVEAASGKAAAKLATMGAAGAKASAGLTRVTGAAGKAVGALAALQIAGIILDQFDGAAPNIDALGKAIENLGKRGQVGGELTRMFGDNLEGIERAAGGAADGAVPKLGRTLEGLIPPIKNLNEMIYGGSFTGDAERFRALDEALSNYARTTNDATGTMQAYDRVVFASGKTQAEIAKLLPGATAEIQRFHDAQDAAITGTAANAERNRLLASSFEEASLRGRDLAATLDILNSKNNSSIDGKIALEEAYDRASEAVKRNGRVVAKGTHEIDLGNEKGRENMRTLRGIADAATASAQAEAERTGKQEAGIAVLNQAREKFIALATKMTGSAAVAKRLADEMLGIPSKDIKVTSNADKQIAKLKAMGFTVKRLPNGKFEIDAKTAAAKTKMAEAKRILDALNGGRAVITVEERHVITGRLSKNARQSGAENAHGGVHIPMRQGGVGGVTPAANGLVQPNIYPASDPPLYQFAEPETGGELFLPRRGDRERGRALLSIAASWYGGMFVPLAMRTGGVVAAQSGYVNVAPAQVAGPKATRLDYIESYLRARDAVKSLTEALKENGRSFSWSTAKGRENTSAVLQVIRAAQDAARTKFEETGSVKAANKVYDEHIARLKKTLQQQKVNAATIKQLLSYASRPQYDVAAAAQSNSLTNIAFAKSGVAAVAGLEALKDTLSLNAPVVGYGSPGARDNLMAIIGFLEQAAQAAQDRFTQTGNAGVATALYNTFLAQLKDALTGAGFPKAVIDDLLKTYGRITLTNNLRGGVYMAASGLTSLRDPAVYSAGSTPMYGWAEPGTGGELFLPRFGDRGRGRDLLGVAASWYGGRFVTGAQSATAAPTVVHNTLNVTPVQANLQISELQGLMRQLDVRARVGRPG